MHETNLHKGNIADIRGKSGKRKASWVKRPIYAADMHAKVRVRTKMSDGIGSPRKQSSTLISALRPGMSAFMDSLAGIPNFVEV